ncbi:MAG: outer membrane protein assembly factor BamA [Proteobacteria bacterium]|nr:MAG: outer membrane protein assembly factor BamA [Pseudomonadota bacterium]
MLLALAGARPAAAQETEPIRVLVAVLPFQVNSARPLAHLETSIADELTKQLEASGKVTVVDAVVVREALIAHVAGERTDDVLRRLAREVGADWVVQGSVTELAGSYSLDVRVAPAGERIPTRTMVFTANGDAELLERVTELSDRVVGIVAGEETAPTGRVAEVRFEGGAPLDETRVRGALRTQPGKPYEGAALEDDLASLRRLPGVGGVTARTERRPDGVAVVFQTTPAEPVAAVVPEAGAGGGERVVEIRIAGNRRIEADAIRARITTRPGDRYSASQVADDIRQIHALGFFKDVQVRSEPAPGGRILTFVIAENPVVRQVTIAGNDAVDSDRIRDQLTLTTGATLDLPLLYENRDRIEALYRAEGYYQASVKYEIKDLPNDAVAVNFDVNEGRKLKLRAIEFEGNENLTDRELRSGMRTKPWRFWSWVTRYLDKSGTYAEPVFMQDLQGVEKKYGEAGYLRADIGEPAVSTEGDGIVVTVPITEGDRFKVGKLDFAGDSTLDPEEVRPDLALSKDEWFNRTHLTRDTEIVTRRYSDRGFAQAQVDPRTRTNEMDKTVDVTFDVNRGPLQFIRHVDVSGNTRTVDRVVRREVQLVEGELYSARSIAATKSRLDSLGFFEEVNLDTRRTESADQVDLDVGVVEKPTGSLSFGAGYSSQDKFVLSGSVAQNNFFGRGYGLRVAADIGGRRNRFYATFTNRRLFDSEYSLQASAYRTSLQYEDFEETTLGGDVSLGRSFDEANRYRGFLRYSFSDRDIEADSDITAAGLIFREFFQDNAITSLAGASFRVDTRNDRVLPTAGYEYGLNLEGAGLGGFARFLRFEARGAWYHGIPEWLPVPLRERSSFNVSARMGYALPFNDIDDFDIGTRDNCGNDQTCPLDLIDDDFTLPLSERYFLGGIGAYQLRGFKARTVGPRRPVLYDVTNAFSAGREGVFTPVGRINVDGQSVCFDEDDSFPNTQGNGDGECNDLDDRDIDDFEDLDETDVIGGSQFISLSAEYRFPISEALGLVGILFFDTGNAFDEEDFLFDVTDWRAGTGFGALWFSPFGPLQGFIGVPLDRISEVDDAIVFEFSVGGQSL